MINFAVQSPSPPTWVGLAHAPSGWSEGGAADRPHSVSAIQVSATQLGALLEIGGGKISNLHHIQAIARAESPPSPQPLSCSLPIAVAAGKSPL
jgi:hypothetical protein